MLPPLRLEVIEVWCSSLGECCSFDCEVVSVLVLLGLVLLGLWACSQRRRGQPPGSWSPLRVHGAGGEFRVGGRSGGRPGRHKMLWLVCPPRRPGHKMSENYTRVIPPLSTVRSGYFVTHVARAPRRSGRRRAGVGIGRFGAHRAATRTPGRACPRGLAQGAVLPAENVRTSATVPSSASQRCTRRATYGRWPVEQKGNNAVNCRWITGDVLHSDPQGDGCGAVGGNL